MDENLQQMNCHGHFSFVLDKMTCVYGDQQILLHFASLFLPERNLTETQQPTLNCLRPLFVLDDQRQVLGLHNDLLGQFALRFHHLFFKLRNRGKWEG